MTASVDPALSPASWVDAARLRQVLNNFASNAVKFTRAGEVEIRADVVAQPPHAQSVRFSVRDTGIGIAHEEQQRLFNPFVQVGEARRGTAGGSGLGLVIARRLVELMHGSVTLQSSIGAGTTVSFTIDLRPAPADLLPMDIERQTAELNESVARVRSVPERDEAEREGTLVLVVDDHPVNRILLRDQLAALGYACECVDDGRAAVERWRSGRFGLVLTDCHMSGMDGYKLARHIRAREAQEARPRTPIIACTAAAGELDQALASGMDDFLVKPVQLTAMRDMLLRWLPLPAHAAARAVIDTALITANWGSDPQTLASIRQAFVTSVKEDAAALREAEARRDLDAVRLLAHRMLGASRMVGAHPLAAACDRLQEVSRDGEGGALRSAMAAWESECARVVREVG